MKKTIQVNLGGRVFTLDEDAYEMLSAYLNRISLLYQRSPGKDEILQDIESRIGELMTEKLVEGKQVVNIKDVEAVIQIMGKPEQFESEDADGDGDKSYQRQSSGDADFRSRRLYRDTDESVIGGVCSGIAHYFGTDPIWVRLAFGLALIVGGTGVFAYILLWIVIPPARTTSEKLSMKGEPVNIESIGKTIEDEISNLSERLAKRDGNFQNGTRKLATGIDRFFQFVGELLQSLFHVLGKIVGVIFLVVGISLIVALTAGLLGIADFVHFSNNSWSASMSLYEYGRLVFESGEWLTAAVVGFILLLGVPFIAMVYGGFVLLMPGSKVPYLGASLFGLWFLGLILSVFTLFSVLQAFSKEESVVDRIQIDSQIIPSDTISVRVAKDPFNVNVDRHYSGQNDFMLKIDQDQMIVGNVSFTVSPASGDVAILEVRKVAEGHSFESAREKAQSIIYSHEVDSNGLALDAFFTFPLKQMLRSQEVRINLMLPEGKSVFLTEGMQRVIDDIPNDTDTWDPEMVGHYWIMQNGKLHCTDCVFDEEKNEEESNSLEMNIHL